MTPNGLAEKSRLFTQKVVIFGVGHIESVTIRHRHSIFLLNRREIPNKLAMRPSSQTWPIGAFAARSPSSLAHPEMDVCTAWIDRSGRTVAGRRPIQGETK
ncbi:hypothetical protein ACIQUB_01530 [Rhizobium sp. NPDC090275]|uniref:hypothetical protein n=1 Tax=Rhizobium sp. NPDC090275 TaxID=3364498 RepID=UPI0013AF9922